MYVEIRWPIVSVVDLNSTYNRRCEESRLFSDKYLSCPIISAGEEVLVTIGISDRIYSGADVRIMKLTATINVYMNLS